MMDALMTGLAQALVVNVLAFISQSWVDYGTTIHSTMTRIAQVGQRSTNPRDGRTALSSQDGGDSA